MFETYCEFKISLDYDYTPAEPRTRNEPGCDSGVDVWGMEIEGVRLPDEEFEQIWLGLPISTKEQWIEEIHRIEEDKIRDAAEYRAEAMEEQVRDSGIFDFSVGLMRTYEDMYSFYRKAIEREVGRENLITGSNLGSSAVAMRAKEAFNKHFNKLGV